ncbi:MAG: ATP-binding cassette domain-containing protein [Flavobacteriales bacterium]|nr:ATP-binding cassette domain-containing protein [Flavobacteriales bacterium]
MVIVSNLSLRYGKRVLFDEVNLKFTDGNCYGVIGANGSGKSTFLKILSGEIEPATGNVSIPPDKRMAVLKQDHFEFDEYPVLETVIMGHKILYGIMKEKEAIYAKEDFSDEDGIAASHLEEKFADLNGWNAESEAGELLGSLGVNESFHYMKMSELSNNQKVRVLLAQAIFGNPDILILDEPTNDLDIETVNWLENFLSEYKNIVIVVSHDRHFLDAVCTHVCDIDFRKIRIYGGNYSFWYEASQLATRQKADLNKKNEEKRKELQEFIDRFSANVKKSKQATSRKKMLEKLNIDEIEATSRKYPGIFFKQEREAGDQILNVKGLTLKPYFQNLNFSLYKNEKVAFISRESLVITKFYEVINGETKADSGSFDFGVTIHKGYLPNDKDHYFDADLNLIDWLRQYSTEKDETFIRGFLGRMLFSGEESLKSCKVLSGGEKVRCMLSRLMLQNPNLIIMDEPTNHLDLESITALNNGLGTYEGTLLFTSRDHSLVQTLATRIIEITPKGMIDKVCEYDDYLDNKEVRARKEELYDMAIPV